jgi:Nitrous oxide-stimulated promoter
MVALYCRGHHGGSPGPSAPASRSGRTRARQWRGLCADCESLAAYADRRLDRCRFGQRKPTCARCTVHCFGPDMRRQIRVVMRYSGPRMTVRHPILALVHLIDSRRGVVKEPAESDPGKGQAIR